MARRVEGGRVDLDAAGTFVDVPVEPGATVQIFASGAMFATWRDVGGVDTNFVSFPGPNYTTPLVVPPTVRFLRLKSNGGATRTVHLSIY